MAIDFSALDEPAPGEASGRPLMLKVADIDEDADQPRKEFDLTEIRASIRARLDEGKPPIKQPISVKPSRAKPGRWQLNDGARRFRSCMAEGVDEIPAWVDEDHDDYDQVLVNNQHHLLKSMELALFIQKKLGEGDSKTKIAKRLGFDNALITHHLALIDAPDCVVNAYRSGKSKSARTLYELRNAYERWPEQIDEWVASASEITRPQIGALIRRLESPAPKTQSIEIVGDREKASDIQTFSQDNKSGSADLQSSVGDSTDALRNRAEGETQSPTNSAGFGHDQQNSDSVQGAASHHKSGASVLDGSNRKENKSKVVGNNPGVNATLAWPYFVVNPLLLVDFNGRVASVLLNRRPTKAGLIHIHFMDGSGEIEVDAGLCKINQLTEG